MIILVQIFIFIFSINVYCESNINVTDLKLDTFSTVKLKNLTVNHSSKFTMINFWAKSHDLSIIKKYNRNAKQLIVDISPIKSTDNILRGFDTSEFKGGIVYVNFKKISSDKVRVFIQLRENVGSKIIKHKNRFTIKIENYFGAFAKENRHNEFVVIDGINKLNIPKSNSIIDILENLTMAGPKKYVGNKITINVKEIKISDLLKMIAEASGFNIIQSNGVSKLPSLANLTLIDTHWDQALDTIMSLNKLVAYKNGVILLVKTLSEDAKDKQEKDRLKKLSKKQEELVTKLFPISFSNLGELKKIIKEYLTPKRGKLTADKRTNTLIVKDTITTIEKIKKIVKLLDTQTPQVLIQTRIVEIKDFFTNEFGLKGGLKVGYDPFSDPANIASATNPGFSIAGTGSPIFGVTVQQLGRLTGLSFQLQLMETESRGKIVSSPRVITKNNKKALIQSSDTRNFKVIQGVGVDQTESFAEKSAKTILTVTPHITNEGSIALDILLDKNDLGPPDIPNGPPTATGSKVETNVLVDNGSTVALGGTYQYSILKVSAGIPYLRNLPLFGWLFKSSDTTRIDKKELVIFITPTIINTEESGIGESI